MQEADNSTFSNPTRAKKNTVHVLSLPYVAPRVYFLSNGYTLGPNIFVIVGIRLYTIQKIIIKKK